MTNNINDWIFEKSFTTKRGTLVEVLKRHIPNDPTEASLDLQPMFHALTLAEYSDDNGSHQFDRGILSALSIQACRHWDVRFSSSDQTIRSVLIEDVSLPTLTVWRVNGQLDALQVRIDGLSKRLYLQTGGAALLEIGSEDSGDTQAQEIMKLFAEPIPRRP